MNAPHQTRPLTDEECRIVHATPYLGWDDLTQREASERCRLAMIAAHRRISDGTETLPIDLPALAEHDDLTPLQAIIWGDIIAALIAMACTFAGGAIALWLLV